MQLRYLSEVELKKANKVKQLNGTYVDSYTFLKKYKVQKQDLENEVDATIYGSDITKMLRISSPNSKLEKYLLSKVNNTEDNISKYFIFIDGSTYKIKAVSGSKVDVERI